MRDSYLWGFIALLTAGVLYAVFFIVPEALGLGALVRIAFFHIPVAWVAVIAFFVAAAYGARYLRRPSARADALGACSARLGLLFTVLATASGAVFSKLTWGAYWNWDPRQTTIFVLLLIYGAYLTLRLAIQDEARRARVSAIYSLFSFLSVPFLVFVIPRLYFSLHPTPVVNAGGSVDMDAVMLYTLFAALLDATLIYIALLRRGARGQREGF